jgi:hydroxyethylthiazole kinase
MGALCAACLAVADNAFDAAYASASIIGLAGDKAAAAHMHPGSFAVALLDALDAITPADVEKLAKLQEI